MKLESLVIVDQHATITSDSDFMHSSCRVQSELRRLFTDLLPLARSLPIVIAIVARV